MFADFRSDCTRRTQTFQFLFCYPVRDTEFLWNNASLTDFNPADQSIAIDPNTGKGTFTTGAKGTYGFVLTSDNKNQLTLQVDRQQVIDINNVWTPTSASGAVGLEANKDYAVAAHGGPDGVQLAVRGPCRIRRRSALKSARRSITTFSTAPT